MSTRHIAAEHARLSDLTPQGSSGRASKRFRQKLATDGFTVDEGFRLKPGYLYTVVRAISARVNQNFDGWPSDELKKSYKTFIGKPVFVNHENHDPTKARGVVVAARYVENGPDRYVEVVQEVDAERFPKLAHEIKTGGLDSVSMGAEAGFTICSYCHNKATDVPDMCDHVLNHKGKTLTRFDRRTGKKEDVLVFESCHKISFFELSYVFEPADETAVASKVVVAGLKTAGHPVEDRLNDLGVQWSHLGGGDYAISGGHDAIEPVLEQLGDWAHKGGGDYALTVDPHDPRLIGASKQAAWGKTQHGDLANSMGEGHRLHVFSPHVAPAIKDSHPIIPGESIVPEGGSRQHEWVHTRHGEPINSGFAPTQQEAVKAAEQSHQELTGGWDPDSDLFDPRQFGASTARPETPVRDPKWNRPRNKRINDDKRRWRDVEVGDDPQAAVGDEDDPFDPRSYTASNDLAIPAPPGTPTIPQEVIDNTPVIQLQPATELTGHEAPGVKQSARTDRPDFPWMHCDCGHNKTEHSMGKHKSYDVYGCTQTDCDCTKFNSTNTKQFNKQSGKYTKEDFAAAGGKKPWESDAESDADDVAAIEIEAMLITADSAAQPLPDTSSSYDPAEGMAAGAMAGTAGGAASGAAQTATDIAKSVDGQPYEYGGNGPDGPTNTVTGQPSQNYDCSSLTGDVYNALTGKGTGQGHQTTDNSGKKVDFTTTTDMPSLGFKPGTQPGAFNVGVDPQPGASGHTSGELGGVGFESSGTDGGEYGPGARSVNSFPQQWHLPGTSSTWSQPVHNQVMDAFGQGPNYMWQNNPGQSAVKAGSRHVHSGICLPGQPCFNNMAQGEQITKDSPNNPVNQPEAGAAAGGAAGGAGGSAGSSPSKFDISQWKSADDYAKSMHGKPYEYGGGGGSGNGSVDCSGYMSDIYSIYSGKPTRFTTDSDFAALGFQPGYKDGAFNIGTDGGVGTGGHMAGTMPDGTKVESGGTNGVQYGGAAIGAQDFAQQWHYPVSSGPAAGVAPTQRAASATDDYEMWKHEHGEEADRERGPRPALENRNLSDWAHRIDMMDRKFSGVIHELVCNGGVSATAPVRTAASLGTGRVPRNLQGLVGTWIRHQTIQYGPDGKPMRNEQGRVLRVPAQPLDPRKPVFVHYNFPAVKLQKQTGVPQPHLWSVEQDGYVRGYTNRLHLTGGDQGQVALNVQKSGADKSLRTKVRNVHAGAEGFLAPHPEQPLPYSKINYDPMRDYDPAAGTNFFYHEDDYNQPVTSSDEMHFSQHAQMHGFQADNWGRSTPPQLVFPPPPDLNASNLDTVRTDIIEQAKLRGQRPSQRSSSLKKIARRRALKLAWGEQEAPMAVDTLREEGSAPEDDDDDFERYVDPPKDLQTPDLSEAQQVDREQEIAGATPDQMGGVPGAAEGDPAATPQAPQQPQQQYLTLQIPMPSEAPQVPMQAAPPVAAPAPAEDPAMQQPPMQMSASVLDYFDNYYGRRVANWLDAIEAGRDFTPAEAADYRRQAEKLSTLQNGRGLSTTNRNSTKGTATMARSTIASRSEVARAGRRQHFAEGPLVDGGERGRNDQGEQEEAFISQTPPPVAGDYPEDDTPNISNTEHNLVARVQQGRAQLLRDAQQLASLRQRRAFDEAGGPTAVVVDPRVNTGPEGEALTGDDFISADPNDGVVPTNPKDASLRAFKAFDGWLAQKTGSSSRRHSEATIKKAAAQFSREAGISPQALFPALGIVLREARKNDKQANTKGAKMRKRSNESLDVAAPDGRVDVEAPVENVTSAEAQASQFDLHDFGDNAGDNVAKPDLSTDQNWAPGEASGNKTSARVKTAGGLLAMRCAEGMIAAGLEPNSRERKYALAAEFERMNRGLIQDRVALLERFASVREADRRKVASGSSRGAARSPIPAGLGGGTRTASAGPRLAAHDPSNDSSLFI